MLERSLEIGFQELPRIIVPLAVGPERGDGRKKDGGKMGKADGVWRQGACTSQGGICQLRQTGHELPLREHPSQNLGHSDNPSYPTWWRNVKGKTKCNLQDNIDFSLGAIRSIPKREWPLVHKGSQTSNAGLHMISTGLHVLPVDNPNLGNPPDDNQCLQTRHQHHWKIGTRSQDSELVGEWDPICPPGIKDEGLILEYQGNRSLVFKLVTHSSPSESDTSLQTPMAAKKRLGHNSFCFVLASLNPGSVLEKPWLQAQVHPYKWVTGGYKPCKWRYNPTYTWARGPSNLES